VSGETGLEKGRFLVLNPEAGKEEMSQICDFFLRIYMTFQDPETHNFVIVCNRRYERARERSCDKFSRRA